MPTRPILTIAVIAALAALTGCPPRSETQEFTASDNGRSITLPDGTHFTVRLESNVTTGYQWQLAALDQAVVLNTGNRYVAPETPLPGAGGSEEWDFVAKLAGLTTLKMEYRRPWEQKTPPTDTFELTIFVAVYE